MLSCLLSSAQLLEVSVASDAENAENRLVLQFASFIAYAWPYYPGKMEAASVLAQLCGEPATAVLLASTGQQQA